MKKNILPLMLLASTGLIAQTVSPLKTFKSKEAKVRANNLYDIDAGKNEVVLTAVLKKGSAEKLYFNRDLVLQSRIDTAFDFEANDRKKKQSFWESFASAAPGYTKTTADVLKSNVLEISSADALSKAMNTNIVDKGKIGLKAGGAFAIQKGDVKLITNVINYGMDDVRGNTTRTSTVFLAKEEIRLKSEEGKNLLYEFHSSNAEAVQVAFNESYSRVNSVSNKSFGSGSIHTLINEEGDLLLVGKRKPVIKFGKAPSAEDLLPVYYVYKISPKAMDVAEQSKFAEPVSRGIVYRETLLKSKSIILVSAPTDFAGDKSPADPDPKNYVIRIIGNDTKIRSEIPYQMPSGYSQFSQAFELDGGAIILMGVTNTEKKDKYINKTTLPMSYNACFTMVIKDGKVQSMDVSDAKEYQKAFVVPEGEKLNEKTVYMPSYEINKHVKTIALADGGLLSAWTVASQYGGGYSGDLLLHFSAEGKLLRKYWVGSKSSTMPSMSSELFRKNDQELYLVTHMSNEKGELEESAMVKINLGTGKMSKRILLGDEKHVLSEKFPYIQVSENELQLFGFDKGGKEFWTQTINF